MNMEENANAEIKAIISYGYDSNVYIIKDEKLVLIDAGTGADEKFNERILSEIGNREVDLIVNTHAHFDHCAGNAIFKSKNTKIAVHGKDYSEIINQSFYGTSSFFFPFYKRKEANFSDDDFIILKAGSIIELGKIKLKVLHTPGHSRGSICLVADINKKTYLFSGDLLFAFGSFGRFDLEGGDLRELIKSLERLKSMEFNILMPGHGDIDENGKRAAEKALKSILAYAGD